MPEMRERDFDFGEGWQRSGSGLLLPPAPPTQRRERPVGLGLFAGAGGFDLGMHEAGIHVAAANEFDPWAALTYLVNLAVPGVQLHFLDGEEGEESFTRALRKQWGLSVPKKSTCSSVMTLPRARTVAGSIRFSSSRTLPGQSYSMSMVMACWLRRAGPAPGA